MLILLLSLLTLTAVRKRECKLYIPNYNNKKVNKEKKNLS